MTSFSFKLRRNGNYAGGASCQKHSEFFKKMSALKSSLRCGFRCNSVVGAYAARYLRRSALLSAEDKSIVA